jgi:hypothetical protein
MGELTTPETKASLEERLRAMATALQLEPAEDTGAVKFIFDLKASADLLGEFEELLVLLLAEEAQEDPAGTLGKAIALAGAARDRLDRANPEPKVEMH